ncbi:MAG: response regulator [Deltaproteobacteria bacterium]|nr:response regulator [Deltaproteobacteria bacterium]
MAKQHLLIVDSDPKSLRVLEVSLKKAGFSVTRASNGLDAIEKIQISAPDMIITETAMPEMNGFELIQQLRANAEWKDIPVMFLTAQKSIEDKIRGLEQGVEDYLTKPIFIREILARVSLVMQRRQRERLETRGSKTEFSGSLADMGIIDLIQTIDIGQKSGVIHVKREEDSGEIFFRNGKVIDASTSSRRGEDAVYRMLVWSSGHFRIEFKNISNKDSISLSTQGLLMEGMRRLDEWGRLQEQLPSLSSVFDIDDQLLAERLGEIPDEINSLLKHFDGRRSLLEVVNLCPLGDLEALTIITKLYFEGLIYDIGMVEPEELETAPPKHPAPFEGPTHNTSMPPSSDYEDMPERVSLPPVTDEPPKRLSTGGYKLHPQTESMPVSDSTQQMPGISSQPLPVEQQTMMRHVSRTPTNPPPAVGTQSRETGSMPVAESVTSGGAVETARLETNPSAGENRPVSVGVNAMSVGGTIVGMAQPSDFDELVRGPDNQDVDTTAPTSVVSSDEDAFVTDVHSDDLSNEYTSTKTHHIPADEDAAVNPKTVEPGTPLLPVGSETAMDASDDVIVSSDSHARANMIGADGKAFDEGDDASGTETDIPDETAAKSANDEEIDRDENGAANDRDAGIIEAESGEEAEEVEEDAETGEEADEEDEEEDDELEDEWAELESVASRGYLKKILIGLSAVLLLGGAAAVVFGTDWVLKPPQKSDAVVAVKDKTINKSNKTEQSKRDVQKRPDEQLQKSGFKAVAPTDSEGKQAKVDSAAVPEKSGDTDTSAVAKDTGGASVEVAPLSGNGNLVAPDAAQLAEYKKLLKKAEKLGLAKQLATLESAIAIHPNGIEALTQYAIAGMERRKYQDRALAYATRVTRLDPGNARAWLAIGYIYQLQNKIDDSKDAYRKCAECPGPAEYVRNCKLLAR